MNKLVKWKTTKIYQNYMSLIIYINNERDNTKKSIKQVQR